VFVGLISQGWWFKSTLQPNLSSRNGLLSAVSRRFLHLGDILRRKSVLPSCSQATQPEQKARFLGCVTFAVDEGVRGAFSHTVAACPSRCLRICCGTRYRVRVVESVESRRDSNLLHQLVPFFGPNLYYALVSAFRPTKLSTFTCSTSWRSRSAISFRELTSKPDQTSDSGCAGCFRKESKEDEPVLLRSVQRRLTNKPRPFPRNHCMIRPLHTSSCRFPPRILRRLGLHDSSRGCTTKGKAFLVSI
jgi:hypothetical protein